MSTDLFGDTPKKPARPKPAPQKTQRIVVRRSKNTNRRNVGIKRNTSSNSRLLENAIGVLRVAGFATFERTAEYLDAEAQGSLPARYVVRNYHYPALYGTKGAKEAFISHNGTKYILECKYQHGSGSVDEKFPYIWEQFLKSPVPNWIVWCDGAWWQKHERGVAAIAWFRARIKMRCPPGRQLIVLVGNNEGMKFLAAQFGRGA